jgi:hypothetical protein
LAESADKVTDVSLGTGDATTVYFSSYKPVDGNGAASWDDAFKLPMHGLGEDQKLVVQIYDKAVSGQTVHVQQRLIAQADVALSFLVEREVYDSWMKFKFVYEDGTIDATATTTGTATATTPLGDESVLSSPSSSSSASQSCIEVKLLIMKTFGAPIRAPVEQPPSVMTVDSVTLAALEALRMP